MLGAFPDRELSSLGFGFVADRALLGADIGEILRDTQSGQNG
jgi:hypothetical protein